MTITNKLQMYFNIFNRYLIPKKYKAKSIFDCLNLDKREKVNMCDMFKTGRVVSTDCRYSPPQSCS